MCIQIRYFFFSFLTFLSIPLIAEEKSSRILHLCFHDGCINEMEVVAVALDLDMTHLNIHTLPTYFFDGIGQGYDLYNIDHARAARIWERHQDYFNQFDIIFTFVASSPYEIYYAGLKNVDLGDTVIKACASYINKNLIPCPDNLGVNERIFVHQRSEQVQIDRSQLGPVTSILSDMEIPHASYRYQNVEELATFKGVLYLPYQWYQIAPFETTQLHLPTYVPSKKFLLELINKKNYFFENIEHMDRNHICLAEWYQPQVQQLFIYFDSWEDLKVKITATDQLEVQKRMASFAEKHEKEMLSRWKKVFSQAQNLLFNP